MGRSEKEGRGSLWKNPHEQRHQGVEAPAQPNLVLSVTLRATRSRTFLASAEAHGRVTTYPCERQKYSLLARVWGRHRLLKSQAKIKFPTGTAKGVEPAPLGSVLGQSRA